MYDYFREIQKIELTWSAHVPCLDVGKLRRPNYLPVEVCDARLDSLLQQILLVFIIHFLLNVCSNLLQLCHLISLQRYTKALSSQQRVSLVEKSRQKPLQRMEVVTNVGSPIHYILWLK